MIKVEEKSMSAKRKDTGWGIAIGGQLKALGLRFPDCIPINDVWGAGAKSVPFIINEVKKKRSRQALLKRMVVEPYDRDDKKLLADKSNRRRVWIRCLLPVEDPLAKKVQGIFAKEISALEDIDITVECNFSIDPSTLRPGELYMGFEMYTTVPAFVYIDHDSRSDRARVHPCLEEFAKEAYTLALNEGGKDGR